MKLLFRQDLGTFDDLLSLQVKTDCISTQDVIVLGHKVGTICTGWATSRRLFRNTYFMAIYGEDDLASLAESCAAPTFAAGYAAYVAAPGEIVAKSAEIGRASCRERV